jgi:hypothetical protein
MPWGQCDPVLRTLELLEIFYCTFKYAAWLMAEKTRAKLHVLPLLPHRVTT